MGVPSKPPKCGRGDRTVGPLADVRGTVVVRILHCAEHYDTPESDQAVVLFYIARLVASLLSSHPQVPSFPVGSPVGGRAPTGLHGPHVPSPAVDLLASSSYQLVSPATAIAW